MQCGIRAHIALCHRNRRHVVNRLSVLTAADMLRQRFHNLETQLAVLKKIQRARITMGDVHSVFQNRRQQMLPVFFRRQLNANIQYFL